MLTGAIRAELHIVHGIVKGTSKKLEKQMLAGEIRPTKKPDIDNILKIILDALNGVAYKDDAQVVETYCRKSYGETPKVEVSFIELGANNEH